MKTIDGLHRILRKIFVETTPRPISDWCENEMWIDEKTPFKFRYAPYLKEMIETPMRKDVRRTVYMMFSRGGKTTAMNAVMGYSIAERPRHIAMMQSKLETAEQFSKEDFQEKLVGNTPSLARLLPEGRATKNTIRHKMFPGGVIKFVGANTASSLRRIKGNLLLADEIDSYEGDDEGDVLKIFWKRGSEYTDTIEIAASYPGIAGHSRIWDEMMLSDWRKYHIQCHDCAEFFAPERQRDLRWEKGKPETAYIQCPNCTAHINEDQRRTGVENGKWIATRPFNGVAGFQAGSLIWPHRVEQHASFMAMLAREIEDAEAASNPAAAMQVIQTTHDALPYVPESADRPEADTIRERAENYTPRKMLPDGVLWVGAGIDVQMEWVEISVWGFGNRRITWALDHHKITGSSDEENTWAQVLRYLDGCRFPHPKLGTVSLLQPSAVRKPKVLVDSGKWHEVIRKWTKANEHKGIYASKGHPSVDAEIIKHWWRCKTTMAWVCSIGVNQAKETIYRGLELADQDGDGYMHFPQLPCYGDEYFEGLVCEEPKGEIKGGKVYSRFTNADKLRNEPLDCAVYARAAFEAARPRLSEVKPIQRVSTFVRSNFIS